MARKNLRTRLWRLYCARYAGLVSWMEQHQPGAEKMALPNRTVVSYCRFDVAGREHGGVDKSIVPRPPATRATGDPDEFHH